MVKMSIHYTGQLHCNLTHEPSGSTLETDAPKDNHGKGEKFSPTDLVGAALGSCILTTMAMVAERNGIDFRGAHAEVEKEMILNPRRIGTLRVRLHLSKATPLEQRNKLENAALQCPVHKSLHPETQIPIEFYYENE